MQVNLPELFSGGLFALIITVLAIISKAIGCYVPARLAGKLGHREGMVVGFGMIPRGEVGLIIASAGLLVGAIDRTLFSVAVTVGIITTIISPILLKPLLKQRAI